MSTTYPNPDSTKTNHFCLWNKKDQKWHYWQEIKEIPEEKLKELLESNEFIVCQSTGIFDKDNREIFENQIVSIDEDEEKRKVEQIIKKEGGEFDFAGFTGYIFCSGNSHIMEVTGNIFQNPRNPSFYYSKFAGIAF